MLVLEQALLWATCQAADRKCFGKICLVRVGEVLKPAIFLRK
jgi:hypothetical protein